MCRACFFERVRRPRSTSPCTSLRRRPDGYHDLESLVAFAGVADLLELAPDEPLDLAVLGPTAGQAGNLDENLVVRAARALGDRVPGLRTGRFTLTKRLPVGAGIGGGSSDAAAALRLLAKLNDLRLPTSGCKMRRASRAPTCRSASRRCPK